MINNTEKDWLIYILPEYLERKHVALSITPSASGFVRFTTTVLLLMLLLLLLMLLYLRTNFVLLESYSVRIQLVP